MENASKALIMIAEVLVGIMIVSIGVYLFNEMGSYSADTTKQIEDTQIAQFNEQFLQYTGTTTLYDDAGNPYIGPVPCTIHDIIGLANLAKQTNVNNGFVDLEEPPETSESDNNAYIQISLKSSVTGTERHLETLSEDELIDIIKQNDTIISSGSADIRYFKCSDYHIAQNAKTVNYMSFTDI